MTKYKLIDIGRDKINREVEVKNESGLIKEVMKHLMSREVDLISEDDGKSYMVLVGGWRPVGKIEMVQS